MMELKTQNSKLKTVIFKLIIPSFFIFYFSLTIPPLPVYAAKEEALTKEEAVKMLSASDLVKKKLSEFISWTGYDLSKMNRTGLTPSIIELKALPKKVPPDEKTLLEISAAVEDPRGKENITGVRADLSPIGRLSNTMLVDSGRFGDKKAEDGVYTLQTTVPQETRLGPKEISVSAANKSGWVAYAKTSLDILINPAITEAWFEPVEALADGKSIVTLRAEIDNPGGVEGVVGVSADLKSLGYENSVLLRNDGKGGDEKAKDSIFTLKFILPDFIRAGDYKIKIEVQNLMGGYAARKVNLKAYK